MEKLGILTGADLKARSLPFLREHFGKAGLWYYRTARGIDERPVEPDRPRKSVGTEDTFPTDIFHLDLAQAELKPLIAKVWGYCEVKGLQGRAVTLKVKFADFQQITRSRTVSIAFTSVREIASLCDVLLRQVYPFRRGIRLLGVTISTFEGEVPEDPSQLRFEI
mgnify:CR=1 FL=1